MTDYEVGYRKPPKHGQFRPGRSGNAKGRPKRAAVQSQDLSDVVFDLLDEKVEVMRRGKPVRMSFKAAMMRQVASYAAKGNLRAAEFLDKLLMRANARRADQIRIDHTDALPDDDEAVIARYLNRRGEAPGDADDEGGALQ